MCRVRRGPTDSPDLSGESVGVAAARNTAIESARGEFLAPLDADDLWHPDYLTLLVAALESAGPRTVLAYAWFALIGNTGSPLGLSRGCAFSRQSEAFRELIRGNFIGNGSSVVMRRDAMRAAGGYDPTLLSRGGQGCEDLAIYLTLAERGDFTLSPRHLVGYRQHRESMSRDDMQMLRSRQLVLADLSRRRPDLPKSWFAEGMAFCCATSFWKSSMKGCFSEAVWCLKQAAHEGLLCLTYECGFRLYQHPYRP
jgi:glycosyltransferase involved in cell wall biosynthesis